VKQVSGEGGANVWTWYRPSGVTTARAGIVQPAAVIVVPAARNTRPGAPGSKQSVRTFIDPTTGQYAELIYRLSRRTAALCKQTGVTAVNPLVGPPAVPPVSDFGRTTRVVADI